MKNIQPIKRLLLNLVCSLSVGMAWAANVYDAASYGIVPNTGADMAGLMQQMLDKVKAETAGRPAMIKLVPGTYH